MQDKDDSPHDLALEVYEPGSDEEVSFPEHFVPLLSDEATADFRPPTTWCRCERLRSPEIMEICIRCSGWVAPIRWTFQMPTFERTLPTASGFCSPTGLLQDLPVPAPRPRTNKRPTRPKRPEPTREDGRSSTQLAELLEITQPRLGATMSSFVSILETAAVPSELLSSTMRDPPLAAELPTVPEEGAEGLAMPMPSRPSGGSWLVHREQIP